MRHELQCTIPSGEAARRVPRLTSGDRIGIVAPSSPVSDSMLRGTQRYWSDRGYNVVVGANVRATLGGYLAGSPAERAADLNAMIRDSSVRLIVAAAGGKGAAQLLPHLDYSAFAEAPSAFMGLSDSSVLSLCLHSRTGVITFHGPTGVNFGERGVPDYTEAAMFAALSGDAPLGELPRFSEWVGLRGEHPTSGPLLGGHLGTIRSVIGTPFEPNWDGAILFIEEVAVEFHDVDEALTQFRLAGVFDRIAGLVVGRCVDVTEESFPSEESLADVILRICEGYNFPIVAEVDLGHTDEKVTLPVGARATIDPLSGRITVLDPALAPSV